MEMATCLACGKEQEEERWFGLSTLTLNGFRITCLECDQLVEATGYKVCLRCGISQIVGQFSEQFGDRGNLCMECLEEIATLDQKWCISCAQIKSQAAFSLRKEGSTTLSSRCDECMAGFAARTEKHCQTCRQMKPLDAVPWHNGSADGHRHQCKECLGVGLDTSIAASDLTTKSVAHAMGIEQAEQVKPPRPSPQRQEGFCVPSFPRFAPDIGAYHEIDWRVWASQCLDLPDDFVIIDVETTGFSYRDSITEVAIIDLRGKVLIDTLLEPEQPIPAHITAKTGISNDMVAGQPTFAEILISLWPIFESRGLLAYNAPFDLRMIATAIYRATGIRWMSIAHDCMIRAFSAYRLTNPVIYPAITGESLTAACALMGIKPQKIHRALGDCQATLALLQAMAE